MNIRNWYKGMEALMGFTLIGNVENYITGTMFIFKKKEVEEIKESIKDDLIEACETELEHKHPKKAKELIKDIGIEKDE